MVRQQEMRCLSAEAESSRARRRTSNSGGGLLTSERRAGSLGNILRGEGPDREPGRCDLALNALGDVLLRGEVSASLRQLIRERLDPIEARQDLFRVRHEDHYLDLAERDQV